MSFPSFSFCGQILKSSHEETFFYLLLEEMYYICIIAELLMWQFTSQNHRVVAAIYELETRVLFTKSCDNLLNNCNVYLSISYAISAGAASNSEEISCLQGSQEHETWRDVPGGHQQANFRMKEEQKLQERALQEKAKLEFIDVIGKMLRGRIWQSKR